MKWYWALAIFATLFLAGAAVWVGAINQDEGWYLYAANLVSEGQMPYRDFQYTQGPLMPVVYSAFAWIWGSRGLLGARLFTLAIGLVAIVFAAATAAKLVREGIGDAGGDGQAKRAPAAAALIVTFLLGCNLYHLYFVAMPKTYALASLFVAAGFWLLVEGMFRRSTCMILVSGLSLAFAAGTRISLGAILCAVGCWLLWRREWHRLLWFCAGGFSGLALAYGPYLLDANALAGLVAAQRYHAARGGFDAVFSIGSLSRLVRWYLPVFIVLGLGVAKLVAGMDARNSSDASNSRKLDAKWLLLFAFLAVFAVQMLAPFPYEDYQVPIMGLLAVFATVSFLSSSSASQLPNFPTSQLLLVLGLAYASAFGSPLLQDWMINRQDRFWSIKKQKTELAQLREVAETLEALDPGGKTLLTQDLYLAIETGRKVPKGLEMGPFSVLSDEEWRRILNECDCEIAALSGYTFAVNPPRCDERPIDQQFEYWNLLRRRYDFVVREPDFGQNATPLLILKRK